MTVNGHSFAHKKSLNTEFRAARLQMLYRAVQRTDHLRQIHCRAWLTCSAASYRKNVRICVTGAAARRSGSGAGWCSRPCRARLRAISSPVLPYRHLVDIMEMFEALDAVAPGTTPTYPAVRCRSEIYSSRLQLSDTLETEIPNFFATGDGAGSPAA